MIQGLVSLVRSRCCRWEWSLYLSATIDVKSFFIDYRIYRLLSMVWPVSSLCLAILRKRVYQLRMLTLTCTTAHIDAPVFY